MSAGYFETVGMRIVAGRSFTEHDDSPDAPRVTVVNESFQRRFFPDGAVGRTIQLGRPPRGKTGAPGTAPPPPPVEIIGVVHDAKYNTCVKTPSRCSSCRYAQMTRSLRALRGADRSPRARSPARCVKRCRA